MKKEPANSPKIEGGIENGEVYFILPAGLIPGVIISQETIRRAQEAERKYDESTKNKNNKPPKPPRRPNVPLGRIALGNT
jgi:hypothetical protein